MGRSCLRIPGERCDILGGLVILGCNGPELPFVIGHGLGENRKEILCMGWRDRDDSFCPGLVDLRKLVEEHEGEFVIFVCDLDHVAVDRVKGGGDIDRYFLR